MRKIKDYLFLSILITLFTSCDNEPIDSILLSNLTAPQSNLSTIDYWPSNVNYVWNYNQGVPYQSPFKIVSISNVNGFTYYNFTNIFGQFDMLDNSIQLQMRKSNGNYYLRYPDKFINVQGQYTTQVDSIEYLLFNHNKNVGETWTSDYTYTQTNTNLSPPYASSTLSIVKTVSGIMLSNNSSIIINNVTYTNVLHFKLIITSSSMSPPITEYYWFSKDIGCIKGSFSDTVINISSYTLN